MPVVPTKICQHYNLKVKTNTTNMLKKKQRQTSKLSIETIALEWAAAVWVDRNFLYKKFIFIAICTPDNSKPVRNATLTLGNCDSVSQNRTRYLARHST